VDTPFSRVSLVGMGLMGGSFARALKELPSPPHIQGISRDPEELRGAMEVGVLDQADGPEANPMPGADLVVYATPLNAALELMGRHRDRLREDEPLVTDLVSLKAPMMARAQALGLGDLFVGSHPMVGGTRTGFEHSRADLYQEARVWLVSGRADMEMGRRIGSLWQALGANPVWTEADQHDETMVWASHLPQLTSTGLALVLESMGLTPDELGGGGRDLTRLAASSPDMWLDLLASAPGTLLDALAGMEGRLGEIRGLLEEGDLEGIRRIMDQTHAWRGEP